MSKVPLILIGGGGHCRACIDVIEEQGKYEIAGIIDAHEMKSGMILGYPVLGNDSLISQLVTKNYHFLVTVGQIKTSHVRKRIFELLKQLHAHIATVVSPQAYVSKHSSLGEGSIVMHGAMINVNTSIGCNAIINTNALIEHDCTLGNHIHVSTSATVNGTVKIGNEVFIGSNSTISNNIEVTSNVIIGTGSTVIKSIVSEGTYVGVPAKQIIS
jgi:sugar O-acyltransferase (sialic acid O-acetyltransferase NeuD family)